MLYSELGGTYLPALHLSGCMNLQGYKINVIIQNHFYNYINEIHTIIVHVTVLANPHDNSYTL